MTAPDPDLMNAHTRARYEQGAPALENRYSHGGLRRRRDREMFEEGVENVLWFDGHDATSNRDMPRDCLVAWYNHCPLMVYTEAASGRDHTKPGAPIHSYRFHFSVCGHFSGSAPTLAGALQEALWGAATSGRDGSDSRWLNGKGGKKGFFAHYRADTSPENGRTLKECMTPEFMTPRLVEDGPDEATVPGMGM